MVSLFVLTVTVPVVSWLCLYLSRMAAFVPVATTYFLSNSSLPLLGDVVSGVYNL